MTAVLVAGGLVGSIPIALWLRQSGSRRPTDLPRLTSWTALLVVPAAVLGVWTAAARVPGPWHWAAAAYAVGGAVLAWVDLDVHRIPDRILGWTAAAVAVGLVVPAAIEGYWTDLFRALGGAAALGGLYLVMALLGSMGLGDVKLACLTGAVLAVQGWHVLGVGTVAAFALGAVAGLVLLVTSKASRADHLAFGPAIITGAVLAPAVLAAVA